MKSFKIFLCGLFCLSIVLYIYGLWQVNSFSKSKTVMALPATNISENLDMKWDVLYPGQFDQIKETNLLIDNIVFSDPSEYSTINGVTTFRGNNFRDSGSFGLANIKQEKMEKLWQFQIGALDKWSGVGWNGQPAIVKWDYKLQNKMNIYSYKKSKKSLKEVIYATLDGKIYFFDLDDGEQTRTPIVVGAPIKGSVSIDPRGYPLLYVGQGIDIVDDKPVDIGYRVFNLFNQEKLFFLDGKDNFALREWGAFDSNVLVNKESDSMLVAGENGIFYRIKLNTTYNLDNSEISIDPIITRYRYTTSKPSHQGIENSIAVYKSYAYFADNGGVLQALNINTLEPLWVRDVTDDTDSTVVLEEKQDKVYLYTGCEVDKQGGTGYAYLRKIDALTGNLIWEKPYRAYFHQTVNGGLLATPIVGKKEISNLVIFNIARHQSLTKGILLALDKNTGEEIWSLKLDSYGWSSPVDIYTLEGKAYIVFGDSQGNLFLIRGKSGEIADSISLGDNIEGSPAIYDDKLVVGTRGQKIFGLQIK